MLTSTSRHCLLIGEESLLLHCGELLIQRDFHIVAIVSENSHIVSWAEGQGIPCYSTEALLIRARPDITVDYLFSLANLKICSDTLLSCVRDAAINFHDGLIPGRAGLNVPCWAIYDGDSTHGITWHKMTSQVDQGDILIQHEFRLHPDETSLSLNARCFELAQRTFNQLLDGIERGDLVPTKAEAPHRFHRRDDKPLLGGFIDWRQPANQIVRLIRAADFGNYTNRFATAGALLGNRYLLVRAATCNTSVNCIADAGVIVRLDQGAIEVAAVDGVVLIERVEHAGTSAVMSEASLKVGDRFHLPDEAERIWLDRHMKLAARHESWWVQRLSELKTLSLPFIDHQDRDSSTNINSIKVLLPSDAGDFTCRQWQVIVSAYVARLGGMDTIDVAVAPDAGNEQNFCSALFVGALPIRLNLTANASLADLEYQYESEIGAIQRRPRVGLDVFSRYRHLRNARSEWRLGLHDFCVVLEEGLEGASSLPGRITLMASTSSRVPYLLFQSDIAQDIVDDFVQGLSRFAKELAIGLVWSKATLLPERDYTFYRQMLADSEAVTPSALPLMEIERKASESPDAIAVVAGAQRTTYQRLNQAANRVARFLLANGAKLGDRIGIAMPRSMEMLAAMLGVWKIGAAYVPLDPEYPVERIHFMVQDAGLSLVLGDEELRKALASVTGAERWIDLFAVGSQIETLEGGNLEIPVESSMLAYMIYTSGSTGHPKGVMIEHGNVANFFAGMDAKFSSQTPGVWLAVTSISFDISVLELFWTLARGYKIVLAGAIDRTAKRRSTDFSFFYWNILPESSANHHDGYSLLFESAKFADRHGFKAVWTPERHFAEFGALFPNPSVISAALATLTQNIQLRAGSCVAPLHHPVRIAEEWAVVDNISRGRVGVAFASGWAPQDFALSPDNFRISKDKMLETLEQVRCLWRGEKLVFRGGNGDVSIGTLPRPVQAELPVWITTAGNVDTFLSAADNQAGVLTHLLGQSIAELKEKIIAYRRRWRELGHPGKGHVVVMLHTLVAETDADAEALAREPMKRYLRSALNLVRESAWNFPVYRQMSTEQGKQIDEIFESLSDQDRDQLLDVAFARYFRTSGLFGAVDTAVKMVERVVEIDVDEIGCLIDYGLDQKIVMDHLPYLLEVKSQSAKTATFAGLNSFSSSTASLFHEHGVSHFQCTPTLASMMLTDPVLKSCLAGLNEMLVGGEALTSYLATELKEVVRGRLSNMYGPTETTVWSSVASLNRDEKDVTIGTPITNTQIYIVDANLELCPRAIPGEIVIAGAGVARGYYQREDLTAERFVILDILGQRVRAYRTGDYGFWGRNGQLNCIGRKDQQIKIRGYRVELGEVEAVMHQHPAVADCAVVYVKERQVLAAFYRKINGMGGSPDEIKMFLRESLPEFMVPAHFVELDQLPKTPNGKVDRNALPLVFRDGPSTEVVEKRLPSSGMEKEIAALWCRILGVRDVGLADNFFEIGGHSVLAMQLLQELRKLSSKPLEMTDIFKFTTISSMARHLAGESVERDRVPAGSERALARKQAMGKSQSKRR